jgi:hypothetical protein
MARPADTEIREALRAAGVTIGSRGRISAEQYAEFDRLAGGPQAAQAAEGAPDDDWPTADLDGPDAGNPGLPADPGGAGNLGLPTDPPPPRVTVDAEQTPRQVRAGPSAADRARGLFSRARPSNQGPKHEPPKAKAKAKPSSRAKAKPEQPWRPTAGLIENIWSRMAMSTGSLPPLQRILAAQAPMSGVVLSAQLRGSLVDRLLLQPAARMEERADALTALVGVPAMVTLISMTGKVRMAPGPGGQLYPLMREDGSPDWEPATEMQVAGLKYCLMSWLAVTERHAGDIIAQAEATVRKGKDADQIIRWIFAPQPPQPWSDVQREAAEQTMRAAGFASPGPDPGAGYPAGPAPAPGFYGQQPPGPPPSTAFLPAIAGSVLPS